LIGLTGLELMEDSIIWNACSVRRKQSNSEGMDQDEVINAAEGGEITNDHGMQFLPTAIEWTPIN